MKSKSDQPAFRSTMLRISPKGLITLPPEALDLLNIPKDHSIEIGIDLGSENLLLYSPADKTKPRKRVSKSGQIQLGSSTRKKLLRSASSEHPGRYLKIASAKKGEITFTQADR